MERNAKGQFLPGNKEGNRFKTGQCSETSRKGAYACLAEKARKKTFAEVLRSELDKPISDGSDMTKREFLAARCVINLKDDITPKDLKILCEILGELDINVNVNGEVRRPAIIFKSQRKQDIND